MAPAFRVIIIGGGPVGLTAAHVFNKVGIDFKVLERRDSLDVDSGASVVLGPQNLRIMDQLGLLERLLEIGAELQVSKGLLRNGYCFKSVRDLELIRSNHGIGLVAFHRAHLVQALYEYLPHTCKAQVLFSKRVTDISSDIDGVKVFCRDGSFYEGDIVIGADGAHSTTRQVIRDLVLSSNPKTEWDPEEPFKSEYKCMWCSFPRPSAPGENFETTDKDKSVMYLTGRERGWILIYEKLQEPTRTHKVYKDHDIKDFAAKFAEYPVTETLKVKDVVAERLSWGMSNLGEGILDHWSWKRLVLVGDACHKFTPNAGLGLNNGIQDVVILFNRLEKAMAERSNEVIDEQTLTKVFADYQTTRLKPLREDFHQSALVTRLQSWISWGHYLLSRYFLSHSIVARFMINYVVSPRIRAAHFLAHLPLNSWPQGRVSWLSEPARKVEDVS